MKPKLIRITTIPLSLEKLLEGQLGFMNGYFEVTAISSEKQRLKEYGEQEGITTFHLALTRKITPIKDLISVWKLYKFLKKEKPSIIHTHTPKAGIIGMMAAFFAKVHLRLHTVAGLPLLEAKGLKRIVLNLVEKLTYRLATNVYPNSRGLYDIILSKKFTSSNKLKVLGNGSSNGIDTSYFSREHFSEEELFQKRKELQIPNDDFVFIFVGRIVSDKGINELVEAFIKLQNSSLLTSHSSLLLVGPFEDDLDPVSEQTKLSISKNNKINAIGYQEDVRIFYALSDAFVFPSYREGFPNVVMQAGAMELPSIVSNINGCNEIIEEGINGLLIKQKDKNDLFQKMHQLYSNKMLTNRLGTHARIKIQVSYERKYVWECLLKEYRELIDTP